jgi:hypothetical protein
MKFEKWLKIGQKQSWIGKPHCSTHDDFLSEEEMQEFEEGDPCIAVVRLYESKQQKNDVEGDKDE